MTRLLPWNFGWIGLLLLGLVVLPWLPMPRPPVREVGDMPILTFAISPDGKTMAPVQRDGREALRYATGGASTRSFLDHRGPAHAMAFSRDGCSLAVGGTEPDILLFDLKAGGGAARWGCRSAVCVSTAWPSPPTAALWRRRVTPEILGGN
jgi:hypothetical protein